MRTMEIRTRRMRVGHDFVIGNLLCMTERHGRIGLLIRLGFRMIKAVVCLGLYGRVGGHVQMLMGV